MESDFSQYGPNMGRENHFVMCIGYAEEQKPYFFYDHFIDALDRFGWSRVAGGGDFSVLALCGDSCCHLFDFGQPDPADGRFGSR